MINHTMLAISTCIVALVFSAAGSILAIDMLNVIGFILYFIVALSFMPDIGEGEEFYGDEL